MVKLASLDHSEWRHVCDSGGQAEEEGMTHVVAINGSPRMEKGNTAIVLGPFLEGMVEAGALLGD
jgi:hypothetical protein